jgi:hypothetical protein
MKPSAELSLLFVLPTRPVEIRREWRSAREALNGELSGSGGSAGPSAATAVAAVPPEAN